MPDVATCYGSFSDLNVCRKKKAERNMAENKGPNLLKTDNFMANISHRGQKYGLK